MLDRRMSLISRIGAAALIALLALPAGPAPIWRKERS